MKKIVICFMDTIASYIYVVRPPQRKFYKRSKYRCKRSWSVVGLRLKIKKRAYERGQKYH
jgi:hypothetical protein